MGGTGRPRVAAPAPPPSPPSLAPRRIIPMSNRIQERFNDPPRPDDREIQSAVAAYWQAKRVARAAWDAACFANALEVEDRRERRRVNRACDRSEAAGVAFNVAE